MCLMRNNWNPIFESGELRRWGVLWKTGTSSIVVYSFVSSDPNPVLHLALDFVGNLFHVPSNGRGGSLTQKAHFVGAFLSILFSSFFFNYLFYFFVSSWRKCRKIDKADSKILGVLIEVRRWGHLYNYKLANVKAFFFL